MKAREKCTIIFATETGKAAKFAGIVAKVFEKLFSVEVVAACDYNPATRLASEQLVLFIASTFGNGEPPGNAEKFYEEMKSFKASLKSK
ncbi:MAG: flavodoxin domain-containing protein [Pseudomonadota bacterium]